MDLFFYLILLFCFFFVSCFCLAGFPFFIGFYSKDFIIRGSSYHEGVLLYFTFLVGCIFTVMYRFRLVILGYNLGYRNLSYSSFSERVIFFIPVSFLFLKCWVIGGFFYWFYLSGTILFFITFDLFIGIFLMLTGVFIFYLCKFSYLFIYRMGMILFLRWKSSGRRSFFFKKMFYIKYEGTWMELIGGNGVYSSLFNLRKLFNVFGYFRIGTLLLFFFFYSFYIFYL